MYLDVQRALEVDRELRKKYRTSIAKAAFKSLLLLFIIHFAFRFLLMHQILNFFSYNYNNEILNFIYRRVIPFFAVTTPLVVLFMEKNALSIYDTQKPISLLQTIKQLFLFPYFLVFIIAAIFVSVYSMVTIKKRYYFLLLAPYYIIDQSMNPITAIKETYYLIPDNQLDQLFGITSFGYADLYRQMYPIRQS